MIILITGVMASGKSTIGELLARQFDRSVHLRGDVFRKMIVCGRAEMCDPPTPEALAQLELRYLLAAETAKQYHKAGFTVVMQDNYYGEKLPLMLDLLKPEQVKPIVLCPNAQVVAQREAKRGKTGYHGFSVESLHGSFMRDTPHIGLWIDNSRQTPEETIALILNSL